MSYTVHIKPSGHSLTVEKGESVLDAALRQGYAFPYGCRNGGCGACMGKLLSGDVDYGTDQPRGCARSIEIGDFFVAGKANRSGSEKGGSRYF